MGEQTSNVEFSVELDQEEEELSLTQLLSSLPLTTVVSKTLSQAGLEQSALVAILITNDETIRALNKRYRNQDKPTDVLSFPLLEEPIVAAPEEQLWGRSNPHEKDAKQILPAFVAPPDSILHLGDLVISWPTVQRQASEAGHNPAYELLFLLSHGVLHLVGYDDRAEAGYQAMIRIQQTVMETIRQKI